MSAEDNEVISLYRNKAALSPTTIEPCPHVCMRCGGCETCCGCYDEDDEEYTRVTGYLPNA